MKFNAAKFVPVLSNLLGSLTRRLLSQLLSIIRIFMCIIYDLIVIQYCGFSSAHDDSIPCLTSWHFRVQHAQSGQLLFQLNLAIFHYFISIHTIDSSHL